MSTTSSNETTEQPSPHHEPGSLNVLVAGGTGMLGREVARTLRDRGHRVTTLSRNPARARAMQGLVDSVVLGDATRPETLDGLPDGIDAVVSCLGSPMAFMLGERRSFRKVDTVANENLIAAAQKIGVRRFVYISLVIRPAWADTVYAQAHEDVVEAVRRSGLSSAIVRPTGMFPVFDPFIPMARRGIAYIPGDGRARTNPIHPADVARVCVDSLEADGDLDVPLGGPEVLTREEIVRMAFAATGRKPRIRHLPPRALRAGAAMIGPLNRHLAEVTDFTARALTSDFLAPVHGQRRLGDYFASVVEGTPAREHEELTS